MPEHFELMIPGASPSSTPLEIRAPWDNALIATADTADSAAVEQALATAHALYRDRNGWLSPAERIQHPAKDRRADAGAAGHFGR